MSAPKSPSNKWDLHTHHLPPAYIAAIKRTNTQYIDGMSLSLCQNALSWDLPSQLSHQDAIGIQKAYLSVSSPGVHLTPGDDASARALARECNDWSLRAHREYPDRIGFFASLPLPDVKGSLEEIEILQQEGKGVKAFMVMTNSHGIYLGDERFDPVWERLDSLGAVVQFHPTGPVIRLTDPSHLSSSSHPAFSSPPPVDSARPPELLHGNPLLAQGFFDPLVEFQFDTARAIANMLIKGIFTRFPNIKYIVPHAGGAVPPMLDRIFAVAKYLPGAPKGELADPLKLKRDMLKCCWFDLAGAPFPRQVDGLLSHLTEDPKDYPDLAGRLLYGSDSPWTPAERIKVALGLAEEGIAKRWPDEADQRKIWEGNARELMKDVGC